MAGCARVCATYLECTVGLHHLYCKVEGPATKRLPRNSESKYSLHLAGINMSTTPFTTGLIVANLKSTSAPAWSQ